MYLYNLMLRDKLDIKLTFFDNFALNKSENIDQINLTAAKASRITNYEKLKGD